MLSEVSNLIVPYLSRQDVGNLSLVSKDIFSCAYVRVHRRATLNGKISDFNPMRYCTTHLELARPILSKLQHSVQDIRDVTLIFGFPTVMDIEPACVHLEHTNVQSITIRGRHRNLDVFFRTVNWPLTLKLLDLRDVDIEEEMHAYISFCLRDINANILIK